MTANLNEKLEKMFKQKVLQLENWKNCAFYFFKFLSEGGH